VAFLAGRHGFPLIPSPDRVTCNNLCKNFRFSTTGVNFSKNNTKLMFLYVFLQFIRKFQHYIKIN
jgi:hypothetical protein